MDVAFRRCLPFIRCLLKRQGLSGLTLYPALHGLRQVDLLVASLKGGYDGSKEDMEGWFPKQTEHLGEV